MNVKIRPSRRDQEKIDMIQPYVGGRKNEKFEQFWGSVDDVGRLRVGEALPEVDWERGGWIKGKKKIYI